jgi:hypothetical protein
MSGGVLSGLQACGKDSSMSEADLAQRVYRQFSPAPLRADQEALYVDLNAARGDMEVVSRLEGKIRRAEGSPTCQVLAGHKGSGKSTELLRLKKRLESDPDRFFVVYVEADEDIDRNDVDFPDVLIAIVRQMAAQLKQHAGINLKPGYFKDRLIRLKDLLTSEINFESFELDAGLMKLAGAIKSSPDARAKIRDLLEPDTSNWLYAANDVIGQGVKELVNDGKRGLVILMDDLDKMVVREHAGTGYNTDEYLFVSRAAQLTAFHCHVIYTMPLSLAYSHQEQAVRASYGGHVPVVPMTKVSARPPDTGPYLPGVERFRKIIALRLKAANAETGDVFVNEDVRDKLIALSGGQPTELMTLLREAIITHGLPIDEKSLKRAETEGRREYARQLRQDHWPIIEEVRSSGDFARTKEKEPAFRELLDSRAILQYVNDEEWYALNPMVGALRPPGKGISVSS